MNNRIKILTLLIVSVFLLTACNTKAATEQPTTPSKATSAPAATSVSATQAGYPVPTKSDPSSITPSDYPGPSANVPALTNLGYPAPGTFNLVLADGSSKSVSVDTLKTLPQEKVSFDGTELEALALVDALKHVGVETYNQVTVSGSGNNLTLTKDQIAQSYLQLFPDGTIRVAVQGQPQNTWVVGLKTMAIE